MLRHPAFIHQPDGIITVSDGTDTVSFDSPLAFQDAEPGYALPAGAVAVNYEIRGPRVMHVRQLPGGGVLPVEDGAAEAIYDGYIARVAAYRAALAERAHPLWGVVAVPAAKAIMAGEIKARCRNQLADTDWYVIRQAEGGAAIPAAVAAERTRLRNIGDAKESEVNAAPDIAALKGYDPDAGWDAGK